MTAPKLIVFEGGDACGKNTQATLLAETLKTRTVAFPRYTASPTGRLIDDLLHKVMGLSKSGPGKQLDSDLPFARVLQALMTWDRYVCEDLWEAPEATLILDRYFMSGCVFGSFDGIPLSELVQAHKSLPAPAVAFLMQLPVDVQMDRLKARGRVPDMYEAREGLRERLTDLSIRYSSFWHTTGPHFWPKTRWVTIDGTADVKTVQAAVMKEVLRFTEASNPNLL
jgi:dTMP kinase